MPADLWDAVDSYIDEVVLGGDEILEGVLARNRASGLLAIDVSPAQGKMLNLLARLCGARNVLEVGTLGGYSAICLASALPEGGKVVTLELEPHNAKVARQNFASSGVEARIELREGLAATSLEALAAEQREPFDMVFIDADKPSNTVYLDWAARLSRPGALIVLDNVVRGGEVANAASLDPSVLGSRAGLEMLGRDGRFDATAIQTVGSKGYDGFALALVR